LSLLIRRLVWMVVFVLTIGLMPGTVLGFAGGDGSSDNPWKITTAEHLATVREAVYLNDHFMLMNDIDLADYLSATGDGYNSGAGWEPIGSYALPLSQYSFTGSFDSGGHTISNLYINRPSADYIGLFGYTGYFDGDGYPNKATIKNVKLEGVNITGKRIVGGLVGYASSTSITDVVIEGNVTGNGDFVGGLSGSSSYAYVSDAYVEGNVNGAQYVGGLTGNAHSGDVENSYALCNVIGTNYVGGLVGAAANSCGIHYSYSGGSVTGNERVGGLVGDVSFGVSNSYSMSTVDGDDMVGGLVGFSSASSINRSYSVGKVTGFPSSTTVGGLIGSYWGTNYTYSSYWDTATSEQALSSGGTGKPTADLQIISTFENWDFDDIWGINPGENDGYPFLRWQGYEHIEPGEFAGGSGTAASPYQISTAVHLDNVRNYLGSEHADKHFILISHIDLDSAPWNTGEGWDPIGTYEEQFVGSFDGDNKMITGLTINKTDTNYMGLFGYLGDNSEVKDLNLEDVDVNGRGSVGALAGRNDGDIINVNVSGTVTGTSNSVGGLVGTNSGEITDSYTTCNVTMSANYLYIGGLAGTNYGDISNSYSTGNVSGYWYAGGLVGTNGGTIENSYATGTVSGTRYVGGLVGETGGTVEDCYSIGSVTATNDTAGGLTAYNTGTILKSFAGGNVQGRSEVGGLVGVNYLGSISNSYATGSVTGESNSVGGLVGIVSSGSISNSYSIGYVDGGSQVGGLTGANHGTIIESYYNSDTSGHTDTGRGEPKTTGQLKDKSTYIDWEFPAIWTLNSIDNGGYPALEWQGYSHANPGIIQFEAGYYSTYEGYNGWIRVERIEGTDGIVTVSYTTVDDTAKAGTHYMAYSGTLTWADGDGDSKPVQCTTINDSIYNGSLYYSYELSNPTGGAVFGDQNPLTVQISDNDNPPTPTGLTATAGNGQVTLNWDMVNSARYIVYYSTTSGDFTDENSHTIYDEDVTTYTKTGLTNGVQYYFAVKSGHNIYYSPLSEEVTETPTAPRSGGGGSSTQTPEPELEQIGVQVFINQQEETAGIETVTEENDRTIVEIELQVDLMNQILDEVIKEQEENRQNLANIFAVTNNGSDKLYVRLTGDVVKKMEDNAFRLSVKLDEINYVIPAKEIGIIRAAEELGIPIENLRQIDVEVIIDKADDVVLNRITESAAAEDYEIVFQPVNFTIVAKTMLANGEEKKVTVSTFTQYVERVIELPSGVDPSKITTGTVYNPDGTFSHVPTYVYLENRKYYAKINSLTNSNYTIIWNPVAVYSVENHWSKESVNDMASRLVINNPDTFEPNGEISRGEFAEYITKALGLYRKGAAKGDKFSDVALHNELVSAITIATDYGIINGYTDGSFRPDNKITREEAMTMYARAMDIVKLEEVNYNRIASYKDADKVSKWAYPFVKKSVSANVFNGRTSETIVPQGTLTYAEAATAIRNLLVESGLINK